MSAEVHDLMLVDAIGGALTKSEALRALEFVRLARNPAARDRLKAIVSLSHNPVTLPNWLRRDRRRRRKRLIMVQPENDEPGQAARAPSPRSTRSPRIPR